MSVTSSGIIIEIFFLGVVILWISKQNIKQNRQTSLSEKK